MHSWAMLLHSSNTVVLRIRSNSTRFSIVPGGDSKKHIFSAWFHHYLQVKIIFFSNHVGILPFRCFEVHFATISRAEGLVKAPFKDGAFFLDDSINSGLYYLNNKIYIYIYIYRPNLFFFYFFESSQIRNFFNQYQLDPDKKHTSSADRHHDLGLYFWISFGGLSLWRTKMSTIGSLNVDGSTLDASLLGIIFTMARHHHDDHGNLFHGETVESHHKNGCK